MGEVGLEFRIFPDPSAILLFHPGGIPDRLSTPVPDHHCLLLFPARHGRAIYFTHALRTYPAWLDRLAAEALRNYSREYRPCGLYSRFLFAIDAIWRNVLGTPARCTSPVRGAVIYCCHSKKRMDRGTP